MSNSAQNKHNNDGESDDTFFSLDDPVAVRNSHKKDANGSEASGDNDSTMTAEAIETPAKRQLRERKSVSQSGSPSSKKGKKEAAKKKGRPSKTGKKTEEEKEEEEEEKEKVDEEDEVYEVESVLGHMWDGDGVLRYKVKWVGYGPEFDTFEPASTLDNAKLLIEEYKRSLPDETRKELEGGDKKKRKRGRLSSKGGKRPRSKSPSDDSAEEEESGDDDDFAVQKKKKSGGRGGPATRAAKARGRADADSDLESIASKEVKRRASESPAPKRGTRRKKPTAEDGPSTSRGTRRSTRGGAAAGAAAAASVAATTAGAGMVDGIYRIENEMAVVVVEGGEKKVVTLEEAHDITGFGLVKYLVDRAQFQP